MTIRNLWKKIPISYRNKFHRILQVINSSRILLRIFYFRHFLTQYLISRDSCQNLRIGESLNYPNWISTNYQVLTRNFLDATRTFSSPNKFKYIIADNVIEHLNLINGEKMLSNMYNSLQHGGKIRITTPDLESICRVYLKFDSNLLRDYSHDLQNHNLKIEYFPDLLKSTFNAFGHHKGYIYDFNLLSTTLERIGFQNIQKFQPGHSDYSILRNLEHRSSKSDYWSQMSIEATRI
jgi:predicted SAM-dependent methyltransferase